MILRLDPELARDPSGTAPVAFGNPFEPAVRGWVMGDRSTPGHVGDPREASAEKGEALFAHFSNAAVALLERVIAWDGQSWDG